MEWVKVEYACTRDVFIDGERSGETNKAIVVPAGKHEFDLGLPVDYSPESLTVSVKNTSVGNPLRICDFR